MNTNHFDIEALIEFKGARSDAYTLAETIRSEDGLTVRVRQDQRNDSYHGKQPCIILWVNGQVPTYQKAAGAIEKIREIVKHTGDNGSMPVFAAWGIYDNGIAAYKNGHSK